MGSLLEDAKKTRVVYGTAYIEQNPLTGDWFVFGQKKPKGGTEAPYVCGNKPEAAKLAKKVDKYNAKL